MLHILVRKNNETIIDKEITALITAYADSNQGVWSTHYLQVLDPPNDASLDINMSTFVATLSTLLDILEHHPEMRPLAREKLAIFTDAAQDICRLKSCELDSSDLPKQENPQ